MCEANQPHSSAEIQQLLDDLCTGLGICLPPNEQQHLLAAPPHSAEALADKIFATEGLESLLSQHLYEQVLTIIRSRIDFSRS